jgi:hypothetical protein
MNSEKDFFKDIFYEMKPENPSGDFMNNLMVRVEKEAIKQQRKKEIYSYLWIAAGMVGVTGISALILYFLEINISFDINLLSIFSEITIEPSYTIFFLIILFLLIGDTLLRKRYGFFSDKNKKTDVLTM